MVHYELIIETQTGEWVHAELGDNQIALNIQTNNLAELKDRQSNYTQAVKLDFTDVNNQIFTGLAAPDTPSDLPYKKIPCRLYCEGYEIAGKGSTLTILRITDCYEVQILGGNADLFKVLGDKPMSELQLGNVWMFDQAILQQQDSIQQYPNPPEFDEYHKFFVASFIGGGPPQPSWRPNGTADILPFVYLYKTVEKIINDAGFALECNVKEQLKYMVMPCVTATPLEGEDLETWQSSLGIGRAQTSVTGLYNKPVMVGTEFQWDAILPTQNFGNMLRLGFDSLGMYFHAMADCTVKFQIGWYLLGMGGYPVFPTPMVVTFFIRSANGVSRPIAPFTTMSVNVPLGSSDLHVLDIPLNAGDYIYVGAAGDDSWFDPPTSDPEARITVQIQGIEFGDKMNSWYGSNLILSESLGFTTQLDLFKAFVQTFGLTVHVENSNKTVYAHTMQKVYDLKNGAHDWSEYQENVPAKRTFNIPGYGQVNRIPFTDNVDDDVTDALIFEVENTTLPPEVSLFTLAFQAGLDVTLRAALRKIANVPVLVYDEERTKRSIKGGMPHLCEIRPGAFNFELVRDSVGVYWTVNHVDGQTLVNNFYARLFLDMLKRMLVVTGSFFINTEILEKFDPFIPVYLEEFGRYFYINKIKNFRAKNLTECELIRL